MSDNPVFLFRSIHVVLKADRLFRDNGIPCKVTPVPEYISSECGMCLIVEAEKLDLYLEILEVNNIQFEIHKQINQ